MNTTKKRRIKVGQTVWIIDHFRAMRTCLKQDLGDSVLYGAGGCILPSGILETAAKVAMLGGKGIDRVCIAWTVNDRREQRELSMWIDIDNLRGEETA